jgi:phage shock protein C
MVSYCVQCGKELTPEARFCSVCGTRNVAAFVAPMQMSTRLLRPRAGRAIAGVCAGLALSYGWDVMWVRVVAVLATVFSSGAGIIAYIIFWIVMPEELLMLPAPPEYYVQSGGSPASATAAGAGPLSGTGTGS